MSYPDTTDGRVETDEPPDLPEFSRRDVLHVAAGATSLAVAGARPTMAQTVAEPALPQTTEVSLTINGRAHVLSVDMRISLLDLLREQIHLTGTKKGCNQGACGACAVLVDGRRINSCLTLAVMHQGAEITTIEGLAHGDDLHPLQVAFIEHDAFQCGYCTSGQIISGVACLKEGHAGSPEEIRAWMSGNICRCGAYPGIVAAISDVARAG